MKATLTRKIGTTFDRETLAAIGERAADEGISLSEFVRRAITAKLARGPASYPQALLPSTAPLDWRSVLLNDAGEPFLIRKIYRRTVWAQKWDKDDGPPQRFTFTHRQARAMRRSVPLTRVRLDDILVWGDMLCRVTSLPLHAGMPQEIGLTGDWWDEGLPSEVAVPCTPDALWCRCIRYAMREERQAFERMEAVWEGQRFPTPATFTGRLVAAPSKVA